MDVSTTESKGLECAQNVSHSPHKHQLLSILLCIAETILKEIFST